MAQKVQVEKVSDLDGTPASETVKFGLDAADYEIDLTAGQAQAMRAGLAPYIAQARKRAGAPRRRKRAGRTDLPEIREYGRARGYQIADRGAVPRRIVEEYDNLRKLSAT